MDYFPFLLYFLLSYLKDTSQNISSHWVQNMISRFGNSQRWYQLAQLTHQGHKMLQNPLKTVSPRSMTFLWVSHPCRCTPEVKIVYLAILTHWILVISVQWLCIAMLPLLLLFIAVIIMTFQVVNIISASVATFECENEGVIHDDKRNIYYYPHKEGRQVLQCLSHGNIHHPWRCV